MVSEMKALFKTTEVRNPMKHEKMSEEMWTKTCSSMSYNSGHVSSVSDTSVNTCLVHSVAMVCEA